MRNQSLRMAWGRLGRVDEGNVDGVMDEWGRNITMS